MVKVIGIGDYAISNNISDMIKTYSLSSCVAMTVYCSVNNTAGMVHIALPSPTNSYKIRKSESCYYASYGIPFLINRMCEKYSCPKNKLLINLFGGADSINKNDIFNIGKRNLIKVRSILDEMDLKYKDEHVGGFHSRTIILSTATGKVKIIKRPLVI